MAWYRTSLRTDRKRDSKTASRIKTTLPTSGPAEESLIRERYSRSMCAGFAAHGAPDCPAESAISSHQCHSLQCSLVHGSGRLQLGGKCQRDQATEQPSRNNNTNELRDQPAPDRTRREGEVKVVVYMYCWGRQSSAILSHPADCHTITIKLRRG